MVNWKSHKELTSNVQNLLQKIKEKKNTFQIILKASIYYPDTQIRKRPLKKRKLETSISHEIRCKNTQQILAKNNQQNIQELYTIMKWDFM